jgi:hypothetical protein
VLRKNSIFYDRGAVKTKNVKRRRASSHRKLGSNLGPDNAEYQRKACYKTQNRAKRINRLDNRSCFGTRGSEVQILSPRPTSQALAQMQILKHVRQCDGEFLLSPIPSSAPHFRARINKRLDCGRGENSAPSPSGRHSKELLNCFFVKRSATDTRAE